MAVHTVVFLVREDYTSSFCATCDTQLTKQNRTRDEMFVRLKTHFSEAQIVELTWRTALCGAFNRFNDIMQLDIEPGISVREAAE